MIESIDHKLGVNRDFIRCYNREDTGQVNYICMLADTRGVKEIRQTYKQVKQVNKYIKAIKYEKEKNL